VINDFLKKKYLIPPREQLKVYIKSILAVIYVVNKQVSETD
jgi:hypothetical protein